MKFPRKRERAPSSSAVPARLRLHTSVATLDPDVLDEKAEAAAREILAEGESANTRRSYASALKYWGAWFYLRYRQSFRFPVEAATVMQFLVDHLERTNAKGELAYELTPALDEMLVKGHYKARLGPLALATVLHRAAVLSKAHALNGFASPTRDAGVQELLKRARSGAAKRGQVQRRMTALPREPLEAMLATCTDGLRGVRDRAILLFAWASGGRRRSEVASAVMDCLTRADDSLYLYELTHSKTDQAGTSNAEATKPLTGPAAEALTAWLAASGVREGPIFRRVQKGKATAPLTAHAIYHLVRRRAALAGLAGEFGAHSLRSGFVTEAARQGISLGEVMALTGHKSVQTAMRYFQAGAVPGTKAANLLTNSPTGQKEAAE